MSRNPLIEAIHEARYEFETAARSEKAAARARLEKLVSEAISSGGSKI
jgi:hypothetical protein